MVRIPKANRISLGSGGKKLTAACWETCDAGVTQNLPTLTELTPLTLRGR
jgi:hypothetical protein